MADVTLPTDMARRIAAALALGAGHAQASSRNAHFEGGRNSYWADAQSIRSALAELQQAITDGVAIPRTLSLRDEDIQRIADSVGLQCSLIPPSPGPSFSELSRFAHVVVAHVSGVMAVDLTDEQLADCVPQTARVLEREGERNKVCMTRAELHEFARAVRALGVAPSQAPSEAGPALDMDNGALLRNWMASQPGIEQWLPQDEPDVTARGEADQPGTWVNLTGDLAEFVPVGEQCSANARAEQQDAAAARGVKEDLNG